jgi:ribokinase
MKQILVLGSLNIDFVQRVPRMPELGETLQGQELATYVGGKGANQACAAALLGGQVRFAGMVGNDIFAPRLRSELEGAGVDTKFIRTSERASGTALILVMPAGENVIVISPGANGDVSGPLATEAVNSLRAGDLLLCQLEIPLNTVMEALRTAHAKGVVTMLDPAPAVPLPKDLLRAVSILTPNQTEASALCGNSRPVETTDEAEMTARMLRARGAETVIVKMGAQGCFVAGGEGMFSSPAFPARIADTTAAGDAFNGAMAVALAEGAGITDAVRFANAAAGLSVTRAGAIASLPKRAEVDKLLGQRS